LLRATYGHHDAIDIRGPTSGQRSYPFYNTARYLAQCIESVLTQSYSEFEYILMDNCSTDGSGEIAEIYARRDPRIRLIRCSEFVSLLRNYNRALMEISDPSQYCKIVQADDYIFPQCLELMVQAFDQSGSIGLVFRCNQMIQSLSERLRQAAVPRMATVNHLSDP
jgi:glycosyltransferase involved in cell wall biosynthesis